MRNSTCEGPSYGVFQVHFSVKEIEKLANSGILEVCLDQMFEKESEIIIDYYGANFTNE